MGICTFPQTLRGRREQDRRCAALALQHPREARWVQVEAVAKALCSPLGTSSPPPRGFFPQRNGSHIGRSPCTRIPAHSGIQITFSHIALDSNHLLHDGSGAALLLTDRWPLGYGATAGTEYPSWQSWNENTIKRRMVCRTGSLAEKRQLGCSSTSSRSAPSDRTAHHNQQYCDNSL